MDSKLIISLISVVAGLIVGGVALFIYAKVSSRKNAELVKNASEKAHEEGYNEGVIDGYEKRKLEAEATINTAEEESLRIVQAAVREGEVKKREYVLQAKDEIRQLRPLLEKEVRENQKEAMRKEQRQTAKEEILDKKMHALEQR
ncbi:MAG: Rnase Y domain-containing protein, partial [Clostridia bacterium]|nr:Rnase Y domain-containing protein [Clostridia bacterium]